MAFLPLRFSILDGSTSLTTGFGFEVSGSSYYFICSGENIRRNRHADLLSRLKIDHKFKLGRLLDGQISRLGAFQDLIDVYGSAPETLILVGCVGHETARFHEVVSFEHGRQPVLYGKIGNSLLIPIEQAAPDRYKRGRGPLGRFSKRTFQLRAGTAHPQALKRHV